MARRTPHGADACAAAHRCGAGRLHVAACSRRVRFGPRGERHAPLRVARAPGSRVNEDFLDLLALLLEHAAEFVVVGAHAMAVHGAARATGDIDVLVRPSMANADRVCAALRAFGAPLRAHGVGPESLAAEGNVYQLGLPPRRIDILTGIDGVSFDEAWDGRTEVAVEGLKVPFLGRPRSAQEQGGGWPGQSRCGHRVARRGAQTTRLRPPSRFLCSMCLVPERFGPRGPDRRLICCPMPLTASLLAAHAEPRR